ncbi:MULTISPECIES: hypothetical protein [Vibrio]|uniref:hypothetical protein n=1 Tax=Vibrio TaxID=662 RepID=UPI0001B9561A|nr:MULTISPECIES: hypothetical protein [Vibrio]EEX33785.1 hypothetical protein VIC_001681 [Vibrio coralliilyticus ATCC BAA-450]ERB66755.1 O-succinylbenzoic acid--CoA ligase [Vibrio coralliilyticus OCN008]MCC2522492.1 hypothetical protein [Vibrio coralliilyticus]MDE3899201.1 hypothetical protein [Vibrio sp. CC007]NRF14927.1 hypothetical protein [Vibrio coralliilyticus]
MKAVIVLAILIQILVAVQSEGLVRSLAELSAFLFIAALVLIYQRQKRRKLKIEPEEL